MAKQSVEDYIIDFSKEEESGGGGARYKEGTYAVKVLTAKPTTSSEKGTPGLEVIFQFTEGKYKGKKIKDTLWATPKAYGRFRSLLEACGKKVPSKVNLLKISKAIKGSELYVEIQDEPAREGYSARSRVTFDGFINVDDYDSDESDDDDEDDDESEEDEGEEEEEDDEDEEDEEDEDDEEEEEEPEPPKKKSRAKKAPAKKAKPKAKAKKKAADDDDDELEDLDLDDF